MPNSFTDKFKARKKADEAKQLPVEDMTSHDSFVGKSADPSSVEAFIGGAKKDGRFVCKKTDHFVPDPNQPRKSFDKGELERLQFEIEEIGQLQPILVRPEKDGKYEIIVGERRWRAVSNSNSVSTIDAVILNEEVDELKILRMQIQENDNRVGVSILEEAAALVRGVDLNKKLDPNADDRSSGKILGVSSSKISKSRAILNSPEIITSLSIDNIVNDYGSLYDLARVYKKHPEKITYLIGKIRKDEINNIRHSVKNISESIVQGTDKATNDNITNKEPLNISNDKEIENETAQETLKDIDTEQQPQQSDHLKATDEGINGTEKEGSRTESSKDSKSTLEPGFLKSLQSGQHIEDIDFVDKDEGTVMKIFAGSEEYEFTLTDDALETLTLFSR